MRKFCLMFVMIIIFMMLSSIVAYALDIDAEPMENDAVKDVFAAVVMLAVLIESLAEVVKAAIFPAVLPKWVWFMITSILGSVFCVLFSVDIFMALGFAGGTPAIILGQMTTGIAVGAGSGFVHTLLDRMTAAKNSDKIAAGMQSAKDGVTAPPKDMEINRDK